MRFWVYFKLTIGWIWVLLILKLVWKVILVICIMFFLTFIVVYFVILVQGFFLKKLFKFFKLFCIQSFIAVFICNSRIRAMFISCIVVRVCENLCIGLRGDGQQFRFFEIGISQVCLIKRVVICILNSYLFFGLL